MLIWFLVNLLTFKSSSLVLNLPFFDLYSTKLLAAVGPILKYNQVALKQYWINANKVNTIFNYSSKRLFELNLINIMLILTTNWLRISLTVLLESLETFLRTYCSSNGNIFIREFFSCNFRSWVNWSTSFTNYRGMAFPSFTALSWLHSEVSLYHLFRSNGNILL